MARKATLIEEVADLMVPHSIADRPFLRQSLEGFSTERIRELWKLLSGHPPGGGGKMHAGRQSRDVSTL